MISLNIFNVFSRSNSPYLAILKSNKYIVLITLPHVYGVLEILTHFLRGRLGGRFGPLLFVALFGVGLPKNAINLPAIIIPMATLINFPLILCMVSADSFMLDLSLIHI